MAKRCTGVTTFQTSLNGLTPSTATGGAVSLDGTLGPTSGGTGISSYATGDLIYANAPNSLALIPPGQNGQVLTMASGIPAWYNISMAGGSNNVSSFSAGSTGLIPASPTTGNIILGGTLNPTSGGTGQNTYTTGDTLYASGTNAVSKLSIGSAGQQLTVVGGVPAWQTPAANVGSFSAGTTGLTPASPTTGPVTLGGTLAATNGGTGQTTYNTGDTLYASGANTVGKLPLDGWSAIDCSGWCPGLANASRKCGQF